MTETASAARLDDPTERAEGFANALVLTVKDQQRRLVVAEAEIGRLRDALQAIKTHVEPQPSALAKAIVATCDSALAR